MAEKDLVFLCLLRHKKELVFRLLRTANDTALAEEDPAANAEKYIGLVEAREELITELKKLNGTMANLPEPPGAKEEAALLNREIKEIIEQIARLDTELSRKAADIKANLQREINNMNKRKKINNAYDAAGFYVGR